jgi:hypothetical protein
MPANVKCHHRSNFIKLGEKINPAFNDLMVLDRQIRRFFVYGVVSIISGTRAVI